MLLDDYIKIMLYEVCHDVTGLIFLMKGGLSWTSSNNRDSLFAEEVLFWRAEVFLPVPHHPPVLQARLRESL